MNGVRGGVVIRGVAAVAGRGQGRVVSVHVATGAGHFCVCARQGKCRRAVIEFSVRPDDRVMAQITGRRESRLNVIHRCRCRVVIV